jgi:hypothetical protein
MIQCKNVDLEHGSLVNVEVVTAKVVLGSTAPVATNASCICGIALHLREELLLEAGGGRMPLLKRLAEGDSDMIELTALALRMPGIPDLIGNSRPIKDGGERGTVVSTQSVRLDGRIGNISQACFYEDHHERITVEVDGTEPLYAELRLPNQYGWVVGQRVLVVIMPVASGI